MAPETLTDSDFAPVAPASPRETMAGGTTSGETTPGGTTGGLSDSDFAELPSKASVSQAPVDHATTYLADKDLVVGHPMDLSHDQVNDAIQTQIYGRPRINFHETAAPVQDAVMNVFRNSIAGTPIELAMRVSPEAAKTTAVESGKGVVRGLESSGAGIAGLVKWVGESLGTDSEGNTVPVDPADIAAKAGRGLAALSDKAIGFLKSRQGKGFEAPDPEVFRGTFLSNPSFARVAANVAQGLPALAAASYLTIQTGDPFIGASVLGLVSGGEQYESSREKGQSVQKAGNVALASTIVNTLLMSLPLNHYLKGMGGTVTGSVAKGAAEFAGITAVQTPLNNIVARIGGDKTRKLFDGFAESIVAAAVSGGIMGGLSPGRGAEIDGLVQDAHKAGVSGQDLDALRAEIGKEIAANPAALDEAIKKESGLRQDRGLVAQADSIVQNNSALQEPSSFVYNDIKGKLAGISRPEGIPADQWAQQIDDSARLWAARTVVEAQKRGVPVEEVYAGTRPRISSAERPKPNGEGEQPLFQAKENAPTFYSQVENIIDAKMPEKASADQIKGLLKNAPGIKAEELDWIGLDEFLKGKKSVTKEEVQKFVRDNNVGIQEVLKSSAGESLTQADLDAAERTAQQTGDWTEFERMSAVYEKQDLGKGQTKFDRYTLPGGENYRELLLTLPEAKVTKEQLDTEASKIYGENYDSLPPNQKSTVDEALKRFSGKNFSSSHFNEPNILAHVRFNDRVDAEGKKVLFLEEVQSDWHQKGRDVGYAGDEAKRFKEFTDFLKSKGVEPEKANDPSITSLQENGAPEDMIDRFDQAMRQIKGIPVPEAPFKKTWHELALKRMIRYAAENGYDKVAWTTGEQQAERYDLSKHIDRLEWEKKDDGTYSVWAGKGKLGIISNNRVEASDLAGVVGKELAQKIAESPDQQGKFSGLDLKVGGEGMKGFYDQMLPSFLNKYTKKWGGRVGETKIPIDHEQVADFLKHKDGTTVPSLDITPAMKESVMGGQPLFQGEAVPRGMTEFTPEGAVISLMKGADASTFLHESAHVWLKDIHDYVRSGQANEKYRADWSSISEWLGVDENAVRLTRAQQEKFAKGFEAYLREGKAPTPLLGGIFARLKGWLTNLYKTASSLNVDLSDNVRKFMDGMLTSPEGYQGQFVKNTPFEISLGKNDRSTAADIREQFSGIKNEQIVRGNQLAEWIRGAVPKAQREGMFWYKAARGDLNVLADALHDPKFELYHGQLEAALHLTDKAKQALQLVDQYYTEAGAVSQEVGTIGNVRENYQNRIYLPDKPQDYIKTEMSPGIKRSTSHGKQRVFDTEFDAVRGKKRFATNDVADALSIHNEEMARVNSSRKLLDTLDEMGLGGWKKEAPDGWEQVGTLEKRVSVRDKDGNAVIGEDGNQVVSASKFYAPEGIAKGLKAISEPNFTKKIDSLRGIQRYQGLVKTVDLSFSFFHHFTMAAQMAYQGGLRGMLSLPWMNQSLDTPVFKAMEQDFVRHTGITASVDANQDILRNLVQNNGDMFSKIVNLPGPKQILKVADSNGQFLFGKVQRWMKVTDYGRKMANWVADHPEASNAEVKAAKLGFANEVNAAYGGLNWEAMGMTRSNLSLLRLVLLAPDWTISNYQLLKFAVGDSGTAGRASRSHIATALIGGMALTEGLNHMLTGHFTDKNKPGHKLEVEIAPDLYVSLLRGGIGDITKLASMVSESGLAGVSRFTQGKLSPFLRTATGLLTNTQYTGRPIATKSDGPVENTYDTLKYILANTLPVPLGISNSAQYLKEQNATLPGALAVASGVARYSKSGRKANKLRM